MRLGERRQDHGRDGKAEGEDGDAGIDGRRGDPSFGLILLEADRICTGGVGGDERAEAAEPRNEDFEGGLSLAGVLIP